MILNVQTGNQSRGHRFHAPQAIAIHSPETYQDQLLQSRVIVDFEQRKSIIRAAALKAAEAVGGKAYIEENLLEEITALNEWPVPITGNFTPRFLALPAEVLITTMQTNQKYFPVKDSEGRLLPHFITFSNIESSRPESVKPGNERVILPRLVDAEFFWQQDRKLRLDERVLNLSSIIFQKKLGTLADKTRRLELLAEYIAEQLGMDPSLAKRAALLSKTDLMTNMVGEFPSLQGIIGRYYAGVDNEHTEVGQALEEQYYPKQSGSPTPASSTGEILSLAEKIDTLTGIFSAGLIPTGDKDPYALRRATLGILRIIIENRVDLDILALLEFSLEQFSHTFDANKTLSLITDFVYERLKGYCYEQGYSADEFDAVMSVSPTKPLDFEMRLQAIKEFKRLPEAKSLASANKRIRNILKKTAVVPAATITLQKQPEEKQLFEQAQMAAGDIRPLLTDGNYKAALNRLAQLRDSVDLFFDNVMVMTDDPALRASRLGLLAMLEKQFLQIADISKLQIVVSDHSE
jgi:glycyl-tRNA synthetase beta chain